MQLKFYVKKVLILFYLSIHLIFIDTPKAYRELSQDLCLLCEKEEEFGDIWFDIFWGFR